MRRFAFLAAALLCSATATHAQTVRKTQTRAIVRDSACTPATGWIARDTTFSTMTAATAFARTKLTCPVVTPPPVVVPPPAPRDTVWSPAKSTFVLGADSVRTGGQVSIRATIRNAAGQILKVSQPVLFGAQGGTGTVTASAATFIPADSVYVGMLTGGNVGSTTVYAGILPTPFQQTRALRIVAVPVVVTPPPTTPPPTTPPPVVDASWTRCSIGMCGPIAGLHDVTIYTESGQSVTQEFFPDGDYLKCGGYVFTPEVNHATYCMIGPTKLDSVPNAMQVMIPGSPARWKFQRGDPGIAFAARATTGFNGKYVDGTGSTRFRCNNARNAAEDPIVFPGSVTASHAHHFSGNTAINANTTSATLLAVGNSTCMGGTLNRSAYWAPHCFDAATGLPCPNLYDFIYYKTGYLVAPASIQVVPNGLHLIAGDKSATGTQADGNGQLITDWQCENVSSGSATIPDCPVGGRVILEIRFPQCSNGQLDSPDHKSHMAYTIQSATGGPSKCPSTHPIAIPEITQHYAFLVPYAGATRNWRLSSDLYPLTQRGGLSAHADYMFAWDSTTMKQLVTQCLNKVLDCGVGGIGAGIELTQGRP